MWLLWFISALIYGAALACLCALVRRHLVSQIGRLDPDSSRAWLEAWLPLAFALPGVALAWAVPVDGVHLMAGGLPGVSIPLSCGMIAVGAAFLSDDPGAATPRPQAWHIALITLVGVLLLLLAAVDRLHIWQGQCLLTAGLILFWHGLPPAERSGLSLFDNSHRAGLRGGLVVRLIVTSVVAAVAGYAAIRSSMAVATGHLGFMAAAVVWLGLGVAAVVSWTSLSDRLGPGPMVGAVAVWCAMSTWFTLGGWSLGRLIERFELGTTPAGSLLSNVAEELTYNLRLWHPINGLGLLAFEGVGFAALGLYLFVCLQRRARGRRFAGPVLAIGVTYLILRTLGVLLGEVTSA